MNRSPSHLPARLGHSGAYMDSTLNVGWFGFSNERVGPVTVFIRRQAERTLYHSRLCNYVEATNLAPLDDADRDDLFDGVDADDCQREFAAAA